MRRIREKNHLTSSAGDSWCTTEVDICNSYNRKYIIYQSYASIIKTTKLTCSTSPWASTSWRGLWTNRSGQEEWWVTKPGSNDIILQPIVCCQYMVSMMGWLKDMENNINFLLHCKWTYISTWILDCTDKQLTDIGQLSPWWSLC